MRGTRIHILFAALWCLSLLVHPARADLTFTPGKADGGINFVTVTGRFEHRDDLDAFSRLVRTHSPVVVVFGSAGGNLYKAMELGRLIRSFRLDTFQPRGPECASACALAFFGGVMRIAEPGAIGVHRSSFDGRHEFDTDFAVSAVQQATADVMSYMSEMGIDPSLLQLALRYDSSDIRYLSKSEMARYRVTTTGVAVATGNERQAARSKPSIRSARRLDVPTPRSGRVRYPSGSAPLKAQPNPESGDLAVVANGTPIRILDGDDRWYRIEAVGRTGYMHSTWVKVDQFASGPFDHRFLQVKSFGSLSEAESYVRSSPLPLSAHLANNGWIAVTLDGAFEKQTALGLMKELKGKGDIPDDSYVTYGNTYVRKVCCE